MYVINSELRLDISDKIKVYDNNSIDGELDKLRLYLNVISGSIPMSDFGNNLYNFVLATKSETMIFYIIENIKNDIESKFNLVITNLNYNIIDDNLYIYIEIANREEVEIKIKI